MGHINNTRSAALATAMFACMAGPAISDIVKVTSNDGAISLSGDLISIEDGIYTLNTVLGELKIRSANTTCEGPGCPQIDLSENSILIAGPAILTEDLLPRLFGDFIQSGSEASLETFEVTSSSVTDAFAALRDGDAQFAVSTRRVTPGEVRDIRNAGGGNVAAGDQERVVAVGNISIIVHPDNPVNAITKENLARVYSGEINNWSALGGPDAPIAAYRLQDDGQTDDVFQQEVLDPSNRRLSNDIIRVARSEALAQLVVDSPASIAFVDSNDGEGAKTLGLTETCGLTSFPSTFGAKTEEYTLQRRMYFYNRNDNVGPISQDFMNFLESEGASEAITSSGLVDLEIERAARNVQDDRIRLVLEEAADPSEFGLARQMLLEMFEWDRLSTTFRFSSGSARLDGRGEADLARLVAFLEEQPQGTEISIVGFTDADGAFGSNQSLSVGRAERVAATVIDASSNGLANINLTVKGFGELAPVACNDNVDGKRINRRVEVWIRADA